MLTHQISLKNQINFKNQPDVEIIDISHDRLDDAADVLAKAFENYPLVHFFLEHSGASRAQHLWEALRITCEVRVALNQPVKGILHGGRLVAVACIDTPEQKPWPLSLEQAYAAFEQRIGASAAGRLQSYGELTTNHRPGEPHFCLILIGVHPDAQGKGYGRVLLDLVSAMSEAHPSSTGVRLDTETPTNVSLYEHCGYHVTEQTSLGGVPIWFMFRPNQETKSLDNIGADDTAINGSCLCGAVNYEITGSFGGAGHCHCPMCRKSHGAAFATWAFVNPGQFRWTSGRELVEKYASSSGRERCFCRKCGSPLVAIHAGEVTEVVLGTVDGDPGVRPGEHIFMESKARWYEIADALPQFEQWPPGMEP